VGDVEKTRDVLADAVVNLLPQIEVMGIERVVEIKNPGLDVGKTDMPGFYPIFLLENITPADALGVGENGPIAHANRARRSR
jgi:hypothetical protein